MGYGWGADVGHAGWWREITTAGGVSSVGVCGGVGNGGDGRSSFTNASMGKSGG